MANSKYHARSFAHERGISNKYYRYFTSAEEIRGLRNCLIIFLVGWKGLKSPEQIDEIVRTSQMMKSLGKAEIRDEQDFPEKQDRKDLPR